MNSSGGAWRDLEHDRGQTVTSFTVTVTQGRIRQRHEAGSAHQNLRVMWVSSLLSECKL